MNLNSNPRINLETQRILETNMDIKKRKILPISTLESNSSNKNKTNGYSLEQMDDFNFKKQLEERNSSKINLKKSKISAINLKLFEKIEDFQKKHFKNDGNSSHKDFLYEKDEEGEKNLKRTNSADVLEEENKNKEKKKKIN